MEDKFAVLIPVSKQVTHDSWKFMYKTLFLSKKLNYYQIMEEVRKVEPNVIEELIQFSEIIKPLDYEPTTNISDL